MRSRAGAGNMLSTIMLACSCRIRFITHENFQHKALVLLPERWTPEVALLCCMTEENSFFLSIDNIDISKL